VASRLGALSMARKRPSSLQTLALQRFAGEHHASEPGVVGAHRLTSPFRKVSMIAPQAMP
jgi:hypothetical protein